jgi:DNA-directed RNA polymerase subunit RPC12/RpoP
MRVQTATSGRYRDPMAEGATEPSVYEVVCPHCKKTFTAELIAGQTERHRGFKCPHCKLFVPADRANGS